MLAGRKQWRCLRAEALSPAVDAAAWVAALLPLALDGWIGTGGELLELLPLELRPSHPNKLSAHLQVVAADLVEAGISLAAFREAGTGRRLVSLAASAQNREAVPVHPPPAPEKQQAASNDGPGTSSGTLKLRLSHPRTWCGEPCTPEPGTRCRVCRGGRWWSADGSMTWHCVACWPAPAVFPGHAG